MESEYFKYRFIIIKGIMFTHEEEYNTTIEVKMHFKFWNRNITKSSPGGNVTQTLPSSF